ncbi:MAG TPA: hotdog domain-containing protein [Sphingobium sp.]
MTDRIPSIRVTVMPADMNPYGGAFGGWIVSQMALGAASQASRVAKGRAILVAADELRFPAGMLCGDELSVYVTLEKSGRSSMTFVAEAERRDRDSDFTQVAATGRFTFVAVDDNNRPRPLSDSPISDSISQEG